MSIFCLRKTSCPCSCHVSVLYCTGSVPQTPRDPTVRCLQWKRSRRLVRPVRRVRACRAPLTVRGVVGRGRGRRATFGPPGLAFARRRTTLSRV